MQIFLAGPCFSIRSHQFLFEAGAVSRVSSKRPSGDYSKPHRDEYDRHAQDNVQESNQKFAVPEALKGFKLERGEGRVRSDEADRYHVAPIRAPMRSLREQSHDKPDQERS